jgi:CRP-like cAMP-binding protein
VEESAFMESRFAQLGPRHRRRLLDCGSWRNVGAGEVLTNEGSPVDRLVFLVSGEVTVTSCGIEVARCAAGDFVGELTVLTGDAATGTARTETSARCWMVDANDLRRVAGETPEIGRALERAFAQGLKAKLVSRNRRVVAAQREASGVD